MDRSRLAGSVAVVVVAAFVCATVGVALFTQPAAAGTGSLEDVNSTSLDVDGDRSVSAAASTQQDGDDLRRIELGETASSELEETDPRDPQYDGIAEPVELTVDGPTEVRVQMDSEEFDPYVVVTDANGNTIRNLDDGDGLNTDGTVVLDSAGTYTLWATSFSESATGSYTLSVSEEGTVDGDSADLRSIDLGETASGEIDYDDETAPGYGGIAEPVELTVDGPTTVRVQMDSDEFDPYVVVTDANGNTVQELDDGDGLNTDGTVRLDSAGTYTLWATSYSESGTGSYTLSVSDVDNDDSSDLRSIDLGETASGEIGYDDETAPGYGGIAEPVELTVSGTTTVRVQMDSDEFDPYVVITDSAGEVIQTLDDGDGLNTDGTARLPEGGTYTLWATSFSETGTGSYTLSVSDRDNVDSADLRSIDLGETASGEIGYDDETAPGYGGIAEPVELTVSGTTTVRIQMDSDEFDPYVVVTDANGNTIRNLDDGDGLNTDGTVTLPGSGTYTLWATSFSESGTGSYTLTASEEGTVDEDSANLRSIDLGETASGEIGYDDPRDPEYNGIAEPVELTVDGPTEVRVQMDSDEFDPYVVVTDGEGTTIQTLDDGDGLNTDGTVTLNTAGTYTLWATSFSESGTGSYTLSVTSTGSQQEAVSDLRSIDLGETARSQIDDADPRDPVYGGIAEPVELTVDDATRVRVQMDSGPFDPYVIVTDENGNIVQELDDGGGDFNTDGTVILPGSGTYTLWATSYSESATGPYSLSVTDIGDVETDSTDLRSIDLGETASGNIDAGDPRDPLYNGLGEPVELTVDDTTEVRVQMDTPQFDSYVVIADENGNIVEELDDGGGNFNTDGTVVLPSGGTYTLWATSFSESATGSYTLSVTDTESQVRAGTDLRSIELGETARSQIDDADPRDPVYGGPAEPVELTVNETTEVRVQMNSRPFDPYVIVTDGNGNTIRELDDGGGDFNTDGTVVLPDAGTYTLWATSYSESATGPYSLSVSEVGDLAVGSGDDLRTIDLGETASGEIEYDDGTAPGYGGIAEPVQLTIDEATEVRVQMDSGPFDPYVVVTDASGTTVAELDDGGGDFNTDRTVVLPDAGTYTLWATSYSEDATGPYTLAVSEVGAVDGDSADLRNIDLGETADGEIGLDDGTAPGYGGIAEPVELTVDDSTEVRIQMDSGPFDPYVVVTDENGNTIDELDDGGGNFNTDGTVVLPSGGTYTLWATSFSEDATGPYTLSVSDEGAVMEGDDPRNIDLGETASGTIDETDPRDPEYDGIAEPVELTVDGATEVRVQMDSEEFDPYVVITDSDGTTIQTLDDGDGLNTDGTVTLDSAGTYTLWATSFSESGTGDYTLSVSDEGAVMEGDDLRNIELGETASGEIDETDPRDPEYDGIAEPVELTVDGQTTVRVQMDSPDFDPYVVVTDGNGETIETLDDGGGDFNTDGTVVLDSAGTYTLWATSFSESATGSYTLSASESN